MFTLIITLCVLGIGALHGASDLFQYDREAIAAGEWWRVITGHLTHWNFDHLLWDTAVFAVLGYRCERGGWRSFVKLLMLSALGISAAVWVFLPGVEVYRGLSGVDSALLAVFVVKLLHDRWLKRDGRAVCVVLLLALGFVLKLGYEIWTGHTFFVDSQAAGFVPLPLTHAVGAAIGVANALAGLWGSRKTKPPDSTLAYQLRRRYTDNDGQSLRNNLMDDRVHGDCRGTQGPARTVADVPG